MGKYDPTNEEFDPNKHNAVFQVPDPKRNPGMVAVCLKVSVRNFILFGISIFMHLSLLINANLECTFRHPFSLKSNDLTDMTSLLVAVGVHLA